MKKLALAMLLLAGRAHADNGERWDAKTVALQTAAATGTVTLGGGAMAVCLLSALLGPNHCGAGGAITIGVVTAVGTIASVTLIGDAFEGTGSVLGTSLGFFVGAGVGAIGANQVARRTHKDLPIALTFGIPLIAGTVIGYHLSADAPVRTLRVPLMSLAF